jgi:hypothetical protein
MLNFEDQDIRDAVAVGTTGETKRDVTASITITTEFGPAGGTNYRLFPVNK